MARFDRRPLSLVHRVRPPAEDSGRQRRPPLLILLHGVGSNELAMASLAEAFDPRFLILSVRSPIEVGPFAFAWFHVTFTPDGPVINGDEAREAWTRLAAFVEEAAGAYGADPERVFAAGFSQGGIVALMTMLTAPERLAGAICMSGRLPPEVLPHVVSPDRLRGRPILILHGLHDDVLGIELARRARRTLEQLPVDLTYRELELGHTTSPESLDIAAGWLRRRLAESASDVRPPRPSGSAPGPGD